MGIARGEGHQDLEEGRGKGKEFLDVLILHISIVALTILRVKVFSAVALVIEQTE